MRISPRTASLTSPDFDTYQLPIPTDPRLPGGGGGTISLFDIKPESVRLADRIFTDADRFGGQSQTWQGLDVTVDAQPHSLLLQGGVSGGAASTDNCAQLARLPENQGVVPIEYCDARLERRICRRGRTSAATPRPS